MNDFFYYILPSGIKIVHRQTPSPVVYTGIMVGAGTRDEYPEENGMAHYIEHCVFKGTTTHTARQIIQRIEGVGGEINAYTTKEETVFYAATPKNYFARTLSLIADMVFRPIFPKKETEKEVGVILEEIESYNDSPSELIYDDFEQLVFDGNPLAQPILGTRKTLKSISRSPEIPLQWMGQHYRKDRMVIFSQGDIPFAKVLRTIERIIDNDSTTILPPIHPTQLRETPSATQGRSTTYKKRTHQAHTMLGGRAYGIGHEKQLGLYLLNNILGGGSLSSRLNMSLREKRGWVYTIESTYTPLSDTGYWSIYFATESQHKDHCLETCKNELKRLREQPLSSAQLQRAIKQIHGQMAIAAENQENNALSMAKQMLYHNRSYTWEETFEKISQLSTSQLQEIANEVYVESNLQLLTYN